MKNSHLKTRAAVLSLSTALCSLSLLFGTQCFAVKRSLKYDFAHLKDYLPAGDVMKPSETESWLGQSQEAIVYTSEKRMTDSSMPVIPFQLFGVLYEQDFVVETNHPDWSMHEFAQVMIGEKPVWVVKDSDQDGVQTINSDLPNLDQWVPEVPVLRHSTAVTVDTSLSTPGYMILHLSYINSKGQSVNVNLSSKTPAKVQTKRNGSTFIHSAQVVSALLDIEKEQQSKTTATIEYNGETYGARKVIGLVPVKALLEQTQGGFAIASMKMTPHSDSQGFQLRRPSADTVEWNTHANESWALKGEDATYFDHTSLTQWDYQFNHGEFRGATVSIPSRSIPLTNIQLSAPLPDLAKPFQGRVHRNFVMRINDQVHGYGEIEAEWIGAGAKVYIKPLAPSWFAARPMETTILFDSSGVVINTVRVPQE